MITHLGVLVAYDATGEVVGTLDYLVRYSDDAEQRPLGLVDFATHEADGGEATDHVVFETDDPAHQVKGAKVWPEWLGGRIREFKVELDGPPGRKYIKALVHKTSGLRRERAAIEAAIAERIEVRQIEAHARGMLNRQEAVREGVPAVKAIAMPDPPAFAADIRDLVGGPARPLPLDAEGRTMTQVPALPAVKVTKGSDR